MRKPLLKSVLVAVVGALVLTGVNYLTAPIIEKNNSSKANGILLTVMPSAKGFETLYDANDASSSTLHDVSETVVGIYKEETGLGFVMNLMTTKGFTKEPMTITVGVGADGKICGVNLTEYPETVDFGKDTYPLTYVGQDSTLADVNLVSGATYASKAFKEAIEDGFATLAVNDLMKAAEKSAAQILTESLVTIFPGLCNDGGVAQYTETTSEAEISWIANNKSGAIYIINDLAVVVNYSGEYRVYGVSEGEVVDVTEANADVASKFVNTTVETLNVNKDKLLTKVTKLAGVNGQLVDNKSFGSVVAAVKLSNGNYGFVCEPYGFGNDEMVVTFVLNKNGAIVKMNVDEFILEGEYFNTWSWKTDEAGYKAEFVGVTSDTFDGQELITGATISSNAIKQATIDAFEALNNILGGNN